MGGGAARTPRPSVWSWRWSLCHDHSAAGHRRFTFPQAQSGGYGRHLPTHGPLFVVLLILTVPILGALTFFPVLALGPLAEETARLAGHSF